MTTLATMGKSCRLSVTLSPKGNPRSDSLPSRQKNPRWVVAAFYSLCVLIQSRPNGMSLQKTSNLTRMRKPIPGPPDDVPLIYPTSFNYNHEPNTATTLSTDSRTYEAAEKTCR